jgi:hypothetical protein
MDVGHRGLRLGLIDAGVPPSQAAGIVFFIDDQLHLDRHQSEGARKQYRKVLSGLDPEAVRANATSHTPL